MTNILNLDFIERDQKTNSIILSGVEGKIGEKTTEVALERLIKVDLEIDKKLHIFILKIIKNNNKKNIYVPMVVKFVTSRKVVKSLKFENVVKCRI